MLNKEQLKAAKDLDGTSVIIAGAGTGKTQTLIYKLKYLTDNGVNPSRICLLTFTNDAANTMKNRAMQLGAKDMEHLTACTYHSFCDKIMRKYNGVVGKRNDYIILEPAMVNDIVAIHLNDYKNDLKVKGIKVPTAKTVASVFSESVNKDIPLSDVIRNDDRLIKVCSDDDVQVRNQKLSCLCDILSSIREDVHEYKERKNLKDYDDLLVDAYELLDNKIVRDAINVTYQYILIDEYQDTNHIQAMIVSRLRDTNHNLVVVGDDYQSIYKFRGAEVKNFTDFPNEWPDVKIHKLVQNYRSTQEILDLSNAVMDKYANFGFKKTLVTGKNKHGVKPHLYKTKDSKSEAELAYSLIKRYLKQDASSDNKGQIAVLYRNSNSAVNLEVILHKNDINYEKHGGTAFFDKECIQDVLSYLRVYANPYHELAWYRILKIYTRIGDKRAADIASMSNTVGFLKNVPQRVGNSKTAIDINSNLCELESVLGKLDYAETSHDMLSIVISHYKDVYEQACVTNGEKAERKDAVFGDLDSLLLLSESSEYDDLSNWLAATTLREVDKAPEKCDIILSTIHSAKGLEWNHVIILDCADGVFPNADSQGELDEELRCFYVAMTRGINTLDIMYPRKAQIFGQYKDVKMSRFLKDVDDFVEKRELK